jgi:hypothetical protein
MQEITIAIVGLVGAIVVALNEKGGRENKSDHNVVSEKLDIIGRNLGRSIDRVESTVIRNEIKLDQHINDHAKGDV